MRVRSSRGLMNLLMLLADLAGFAAAAMMVLILNWSLKLFVLNEADLKYLIVPVSCLVLFMYSKLYPGVGISPPEEIKLVTQYVTTSFVGGWAVLVWLGPSWARSHFAFPILWALSMPSVVLLRWGVRLAASKVGLWGEPVVVMGGREGVGRTIGYFTERRRLGYVPVMAVVDAVEGDPQSLPVPVLDRSSLLHSNTHRFAREGIRTLLVDAPDISEFMRSDESKALFRLFRRLILVSDVDWLDGASMHVQDFEGVIGIGAEKGILTPADALLKRTMDVVVSTLTGIVLLPMMLVAALWIKLDSPGPAIYDQARLAKNRRKTQRVGEHRRAIKMYKFRTMFINAASELTAYLRTHPEEQLEWEQHQKLVADPRITRAGRFLRKFSIDEMPQLLNVLKGEMSLVGPRPMLEDQASLYGSNLEAYTGVRPGMTGLWQVSGRNRTTFADRARYDVYYIHNWSIWLDIYILLRTAWVVLSREGAY